MSDAWVFAAIAYDRPPTAHTLAEVIAVADRIDHCVVTEAEFTRAIGRLLAAGLIEADPEADRYCPTPAGSRIKERWRHGLFDWSNSLLPQLQRVGDPRDTDWSLAGGVFERAVRDYLGSWPNRTHPGRLSGVEGSGGRSQRR